MTVVSTKEFNTNQKMYFDLAINDKVFIKRGKNIFIVTSINSNDYDDYSTDLAEAMERADDESTNADDFIRYLRGTN